MRGTRCRSVSQTESSRIIPAHAGNSAIGGCRACGRPDHPRACGELRCGGSASGSRNGSSPRMRGTHVRCHRPVDKRRIIPAHAGNSGVALRLLTASSDHPRACGELLSSHLLPPAILGSSPRMRGTPYHATYHHELSWIIPAHAGNSQPRTSPHALKPDHPRACGELGPCTTK